jgi:hypothetical protein
MWRGGTTVVCQSYWSPAALYPLCTVQRLITAARLANKLYSDWGVTSTTAGQLSSTLNRCDFHFSVGPTVYATHHRAGTRQKALHYGCAIVPLAADAQSEDRHGPGGGAVV